MHAACALILTLFGAAPEPPLKAVPKPQLARTAALFAAGAATGFVAHETGHLALNAALFNRPRIVPLRGFGVVPFFAISPEIYCPGARCVRADGQPFAAGRRGKFAIVSAGFEVQHLVNEVILTQTPELRLQRAPWRKGWLAFNVALSVGYALSTILGIEDSHGDAGGCAYLARWPRTAMGLWLLTPAVLDAYRYTAGDGTAAPWASRAFKAGFVGLNLAI